MADEFKQQLNLFLTDLKREKIVSSFNIAMNTVMLLRRLVGNTRWATAQELMEAINEVGVQVMLVENSESAAGNMIRRVLKIVREEYTGSVGKENEAESADSLQNVLLSSRAASDFTRPTQGLKSQIIDSLNELISELETCRDNIAAQAIDHIHSNEVIMTFGQSRTVEKFLKNAARKRKFSVIVGECAPYYRGQELALSLAEAGIETTVISDASIFAMMSRVNKVIIGTHAVMADGGLKAVNGAQALALAAKHHSVPLLACAGLFKLSPRYVCSYDQDDLNQMLSPDDVFTPQQHNSNDGSVSVYNPLCDYISPDLVNLYISDQGGSTPSYMYHLLAELYHQEDYDLERTTSSKSE